MATTSKTPKRRKLRGDQLWQYYKIQNLQIAKHYREIGYDNYADRILQCSSKLSFNYGYPEGEFIPKRLVDVKFCRVRWCIICQWRRSKVWQAKVFQSLPSILKQYPKHRWLFLTLSVKNCELNQLRQTFQWMNKSFDKWTDRKDWPVDGWLKSLEVTRSEDGLAHPHFHCLLLIPPEYFEFGYMSHSDWVTAWQKALKVDYLPGAHIKAIPAGQVHAAIPELLKYSVKPQDLAADAAWLGELTNQMHKLHAIDKGGILRHIMKDVVEGSEDLIGHKDITSMEESEASSTWIWAGKGYEQVYKLGEDFVEAQEVLEYLLN